MPFYEYECSNCKFYTEVMQKISDAPSDEVSVMRQERAGEAGLGAQLPPEGRRLVRDRLQGRQGKQAQSRRCRAGRVQLELGRRKRIRPRSPRAPRRRRRAPSPSRPLAASVSTSAVAVGGGSAKPAAKPASKAPAGKSKVAAKKGKAAPSKSKAKPAAKKKARR